MRPYGNGKGGGEDSRRPGRVDSPRIRDARRMPPEDDFGRAARVPGRGAVLACTRLETMRRTAPRGPIRPGRNAGAFVPRIGAI